MTTLLAYHNDPKVRAKYLRRVRAHAKDHEILRGYGYWKGGWGDWGGWGGLLQSRMADKLIELLEAT